MTKRRKTESLISQRKETGTGKLQKRHVNEGAKALCLAFLQALHLVAVLSLAHTLVKIKLHRV